MYAIQMPLKHKEQKKLWLSVEVVPGATPFLFSKKSFSRCYMARWILEQINASCEKCKTVPSSS